MYRKSQFKFLAMLLVAAFVFGCTDDARQRTLVPDVLAIGVLPDQSKSRLLLQYTPLIRYLEKETSLDIELVMTSDYAELLDEFDAGRLHVVNFGGLTFVQSESRSGAEPLVMRDTDLGFMSCFFVKGSHPGQSITDFKGEAFAFGPHLSTSGHLMPRRYLGLTGLDPEQYFSSVIHSSGHDETVTWVKEGRVTIGTANCVILRSMLHKKGLNSNELRIIATTPTYSNYVWAAQKSIHDSVRTSLRDAFLALDATVPAHKAILQSLGANGYLPAGRADFDEVRFAAQEVGLLNSVDAD